VIAEGGGKKAALAQKKKGKMTVRERLRHLLDEDRPFIEFGAFAGYEMYEEHGGCPAGGGVCGIGYVSGRQCVILANDQTVKAGAWFPITGKKNLRMQEIAMENRLPVIYLVDSAGVFLPMQDEIFPDKEHFGRIFRNNARMSAMGITQIAVVTGPCVAGGAYLPIMSDETIMVENAGSIFLAGPYLVKAAVGEDVDAETLGGAVTHTEISGIADYRFSTEKECLDQVRKIFQKMGPVPLAGFNRLAAKPPAARTGGVMGILSEGNAKPYDMLDLIDGIVDEGSLEEFKKEYGKTIVCAYARIDGWAVGIVANQRLVVKNRKGELVNAVANSIVPKFTVIIGNSFGAGNYAMCGKAYDPRLILAWPTAKIAVMGGEAAAKTLLQIEVAAQKSKGKQIDEQTEKDLLASIMRKYQDQLNPLYAAARLWVDEIIDPADTRMILAEGISASNHAPLPPTLQNGVFQV